MMLVHAIQIEIARLGVGIDSDFIFGFGSVVHFDVVEVHRRSLYPNAYVNRLLRGDLL
jgi:hypothetical protein